MGEEPTMPSLSALARTFVILSATVACLTTGLGASPAHASLGTSTYRFQDWAAENMGTDHSWTLSEATAAAKRFDLITAKVSSYQDYVSQMKSANPGLVLLTYQNGTFATFKQGSAFPDSWYLRDRYGRKVRSVNFGNYLMNPTISGWISNRAAMCQNDLAASHYDGCNLDMLGLAPLNAGYVTGLPINPATGKVWTASQWVRATSNLAAAVKKAVAPKLVTGNGLMNGVRYFDPAAPTSQILTGVDAGVAEAWLRTPGASFGAFPGATEWRQSVRMLVDAASKGKAVLTLTKLWISATASQKAQWHRFALATFLMGAGGRSYFSFSDSSSQNSATVTPWTVGIGSPTGPYYAAGNAFRRDFSAGTVLVNDTATSVKVSLGATYVTSSGSNVTSLTLQPHTGEILKLA
jgi:uncharacterized short protein YbdD (DUF466 family)